MNTDMLKAVRRQRIDALIDAGDKDGVLRWLDAERRRHEMRRSLATRIKTARGRGHRLKFATMDVERVR